MLLQKITYVYFFGMFNLLSQLPYTIWLIIYRNRNNSGEDFCPCKQSATLCSMTCYTRQSYTPPCMRYYLFDPVGIVILTIFRCCKLICNRLSAFIHVHILAVTSTHCFGGLFTHVPQAPTIATCDWPSKPLYTSPSFWHFFIHPVHYLTRDCKG